MGRTELSRKELSRAEVMARVKAASLRLREAAELLELSYRQAKRIWARYRGGGAKALQHGNGGRRSNRAYAEEFRTTVLEQVRHRYEEFGPTLAAEHLASDDGLAVPVETLRRWMKQAGLWQRQRGASHIVSDENAERTSASWSRWTVAFMSGWKSAGPAAV